LKLKYNTPIVQGIFKGFCTGGEKRLKGEGVKVTGGIAFWRDSDHR